MTNVNGKSSIDRFAEVNSNLLDAYSQKCLDYKYENFIKQLREINFANGSMGLYNDYIRSLIISIIIMIMQLDNGLIKPVLSSVSSSHLTTPHNHLETISQLISLFNNALIFLDPSLIENLLNDQSNLPTITMVVLI